MFRLFLVVLLAGAACIVLAAPATRTFTLKDYINHQWSNELVHYAVMFQPGECWPRGVRLSDADGKAVPVQLSDVEKHPDGSVARANVWFITTLPANGSVSYTLRGGKKADTPAKYATDLAVKSAANAIEITTSQVGVCLLTGSKTYPKPVAASTIPAPLQAVRLRSSKWTGRGWFETKQLCTGYSAKLTDNGPVFKKVVIRYTFAKPAGWARDGELSYEMTVRVAAGQEIAYITEDYNLGDPKVYQYPKFKDEKQEMLWDWWAWRPHEAPDNFCFSFTGAFLPTNARTVVHTVTAPEKGKTTYYRGENDYPLPFTADRFEYALNPWGRGEPDQSMIYTMYRATDPQSDVVAILPSMASRWRHPDMLPHEPNFINQHTDTSDLRVYTTKKPDIFVRAPLSLGRREWALATLRNPGVVTDETSVTVVSRLSRKYGSVPLDKVKDWVLEWPQTAKYPHLFVEAGDLDGLRTRINSLPALAESLRKEAHIPMHRWLLDGKDADFEAAYQEIITKLDESIAESVNWPYGGERLGINAFPAWMQTYGAQADVLLGNPKMTSEQRKALFVRLSYLTYFIWDGEYMPPRKTGYGWGSGNMPVNVGGARGIMSSVLSDHPMAKVWVPTSAKYTNYVIQQYFSGDGSSFSCPHYMVTTGGPVVTVALALQRTGLLGDIKETFPNLYHYGRFLVDLMPPKDVRFGQRVLPTIGDTYWDGSPLPGELAGLFKDSDPQLAGEMMQTWLESGQSLDGFMNAAYYFDPTISPKETTLPSVAYPGFGAFLRNGAGSEEESYIAARFGNFAIDHMHEDTGTIHWYARGVPLSMDWASMYTPRASQPWWHNTVSYNHVEHAAPVPCPGRGHKDCFYTGKSWYDHTMEPETALMPIADPTASSINEVTGNLAAFATQPGADYLRGEVNRHWFEKEPYYRYQQGDPAPFAQFTEFEKLEITHPFPWVRQFAFIKDEKPNGPNYLVITDDFTGNQEMEPGFNFWCLASAVKETGTRQYSFTGQLGIDCDMFILQPGDGRIQLDEWGHTQNFAIGTGIEENQKLVRVFGKPDGQGFRVVLYPRKADEPQPKAEALADGKLIKVTLPDQTHWILLSKEPVTVSDGQVSLTGTAGVVKRWNDGREQLTLLAGGKAAYGDFVLEAEKAASKTK